MVGRSRASFRILLRVANLDNSKMRSIELLLARILGFSLVLFLKVLRHHSMTLPISKRNNSIRLFFSDATEEPGFKDWVSMHCGMTSSAIDLLVKSGILERFGTNFVKAICIVRGRRERSFLLGNTFVFFPPATNDENQIRRLFINDIAWLMKRNMCYYKEKLPIKDCIREATCYANMVLKDYDIS